MLKYSIGQWINYSAELFLIRGEYKRLFREGKGIIIKIHADGYIHVFNGVRIALVRVTDIY